MSDHQDIPTCVLFTGPPGSGKTHRLLELFHDARREKREDRVLFVVPDANAREHLRDILAGFAPDDVPKAFSDRGIQTLPSLIRLLAGSVSAGPMHRRALVDKWVEDGKLDGGQSPILETPGGRASLARAIGTLRRQGITAKKLGKLSEAILGENSPLLHAMRLWEQWLNENPDEQDELDNLIAAASNGNPTTCGGVQRWDIILIDGFTEIGPMQRQVIESIVGKAERAFAALDPNQFPSRELYEQFKDRGFKDEALKPGVRWSDTCVMNWLAGIDSWSIDAPRPDSECPDPAPDELILIEAADPRIEAAALARQIAKCVRDGFKYSDIAIISPRLGEFRPTLEIELGRAGIPVRFYVDRPLLETAPGALLDAILTPATGDWNDEKICSLLAHAGSGVSADHARSAYEYTSRKARLGEIDKWLKWTSDLDSASGLLNQLAELGKEPVCDPVEFAASLLELVGGPLREAWRDTPAQLLTEEGWAWEKVASTIKSAARAFRDVWGEQVPAKVAGFLRAELGRARGRPLDRRRDCVNAVTLLGSRTWSVPVAMVCGLTRNNFPRRPPPDAFLTDDIREKLDPPLPTSDELLRREQALFRVAVTRASKRLVLSRPTADLPGSPLLETVPLRLLTDWLGPVAQKCKEEIIHEPPFEPEHATYPTDIASIAFSKGIDDAKLLEKLSQRCNRPLAETVLLDRCESAELENTDALIEAILGSPESPITLKHLNNLAQCPYKFFSSRVLRLREPDRNRIRKGLDYMAWGIIAHSALAAWHRSERTADFETLVKKAADTELTGIPRSSVTEGRLRQIVLALERFSKFEREYILQLGFRQEYAELSFERDDNGETRKPIDWKIDADHTLTLGGRIDRVDIGDANTAMVADYKRSPHSATNDFRNLKENLNFQLAVYIALVEEGLNLEVALACFLPLIVLKPDVLKKVLATPEIQEIIEDAGIKGRGTPTAPADHLERAEKAISALIEKIPSDSITPKPADKNQCGEICPYSDLCRYRFTGDEGFGEGGDA